MQEGYYGGGGKPKKMTKKQIQEMINNMKKTDIIQEKSRKYHETEESEADNILRKLDEKHLNSDFTN